MSGKENRPMPATATPGLPTPTVMLSSTVSDLFDVRKRAHRICAELELTIESMDGSGAMADSARAFSIRLVDRADLYVGIVAESAGSKPEGDELRYTRLEYERAREKNLPRLLFLARVDDEPALEGDVAEIRSAMLDDAGAVASFFDGGDDFETRLHNSLADFIEEWRSNRGFNPEQTELLVEPAIVEQGETFGVFLRAQEHVAKHLEVRFAGRVVELDDTGRGSATAGETGNHRIDLVFRNGDDENVVQSATLTVTRAVGHLDDLALAGAFTSLSIWLLLGFSHPEALDPPAGAEPFHFREDLVGHMLTFGILVGVLLLRTVWRRTRRGLGEALLSIDEQWQSLRWPVSAVSLALLATLAYLNVDFIVGDEQRWWWSQDAGPFAPWLIAIGHFILALWPSLLVALRLGLALVHAVRDPTRVATFDPASRDGHFGLAWLGNTMCGFLAVASVPLIGAAILHFMTHDDSGLGVPIAILLGTLIIGLLGAIPVSEAYARLEGLRHQALAAEQQILGKLRDKREAALLDREREERSRQIADAEQRMQIIADASALVIGRSGLVAIVVIAALLILLVVSLLI